MPQEDRNDLSEGEERCDSMLRDSVSAIEGFMTPNSVKKGGHLYDRLFDFS